MGDDENCTCETDGPFEPHPCPFDEAINDGSKECTCCPFCTENCKDSI